MQKAERLRAGSSSGPSLVYSGRPLLRSRAHSLLDLPREHPLLRDELDLVAEALLLEKTRERTADVWIRHCTESPRVF
jgi:hypothetical protein